MRTLLAIRSPFMKFFVISYNLFKVDSILPPRSLFWGMLGHRDPVVRNRVGTGPREL